MAYTPTNWSCGDTITADKMNKLEQGLAECCSGGGILAVRVVEELCPDGVNTRSRLTSTWQEMKDAWDNGIVPVLFDISKFGYVCDPIMLQESLTEYDANTLFFNSTFSTENPNNYPVNGTCEGEA